MATVIQRRRGTAAQHTTFTGAAGELTIKTDTKELVVHDGSTPGGWTGGGFLQGGTSAIARTVQSKLRDVVSVKDFGAVGDGVTNDTAAIQAAIDAVGAGGGGIVFFPTGTYKTTSALNVDRNFVTLKGVGIAATRIAPATTGQVGVLFQKAGGGPIEYCGIEGVDIFPTVAIADCIRVVDHFWFTAKSVRLPTNYTTGINLYKGTTSYLAFLEDVFTNGGAVGVRVGENGTGDIQNVFLYNCHLNSASVAGLRVVNVGGLQFVGGEILYCNRGLVIETSGSDRVKGVFVTSVFLDTATNETLRLSVISTSARMSGVSFNACSFNFSQSGDGAIVSGPAGDPGQCERIRFDGCDFLLNRLNGAYITNCRDIDFVACHFHGNSNTATNVNSGLFVDNGTQGLRVNGGSFGSEDEFSASQKFGIVLSGSASEVRISGVDVTGNATGGIDDIGASDLVIRDCVGYRTNNRGAATITSGGTSVTVNHGLAVTPAKEDIMVTPASDPGQRFWVSSTTSTQFTITTNAAVPSDAFFGWAAGVKGA